ncbi:hypothetical protein V2H77_14195 [Photorhabdus sp. P32]
MSNPTVNGFGAAGSCRRSDHGCFGFIFIAAKPAFIPRIDFCL